MTDELPEPDQTPIRPNDTGEADRRAHLWSTDDPFKKEVAPSLLSRADIQRYAIATGMLLPFDKKRLKTASYEIRPGGRFIYWKKVDGEIKRIDGDITSSTRSITLPANSISYVQVDTEFRLPLYIALRFNLRITHVHRGILLGTGPLVDPGFKGTLLIPLHNLTATDYELDLDRKNEEDGLIWVEFTKTTFDKVRDEHTKFDPRKIDKTPEYYLRKANGGNPILSSIHEAVQEARQQAEQANRSVKLISSVGIAAIVGIVIGFYSLIQSTTAVVQSASSHVTASQSTQIAIEREVGDLKAQIAQLTTRLKANEDALQHEIGALKPTKVNSTISTPAVPAKP